MEPIFYEVEHGFGYQVGQVIQDYDPEEPGFVVMSRERAELLAAQVAERLAAEAI